MPDIQELKDGSIQDTSSSESGTDIALLQWLVSANELLPPYWSTQRDKSLRLITYKGDHLSGATYAMIGRLTTIPFRIKARNPSITSHVKQAELWTENLIEVTDFYRGWNFGFGKWLLDLFNQDNGAFWEIIADGPKDQPIIGSPMGIAPLDASMCIRTSNPEFPVKVIVQDKQYKLHYTRVISSSSMPSSDRRMNGVGFCATSRCVYTAQHLVDIAIYEQEKLGSRPARQLIVGKQITADEIMKAFRKAELAMNSQQLNRFSKNVVIGSIDREIDISILDLVGTPDWFDKDVSIRWGMAAIALAFGVDYRELWPATVTGATKADATIQHLKAKGKGIGEVIQIVERQFNQKLLPGHLEMKFDFLDDQDDALTAEITDVRSQAYERFATNNLMTMRVIHEKMRDDGTISEVQFEDMELEEGRLVDGSPVTSLFLSDDSEMRQLLKLPGFPKPLEDNDMSIVDAIDKKILEVKKIGINTGWETIIRQTKRAIAALEALRNEYEPEEEEWSETQDMDSTMEESSPESPTQSSQSNRQPRSRSSATSREDTQSSSTTATPTSTSASGKTQ